MTSLHLSFLFLALELFIDTEGAPRALPMDSAYFGL